jgi:magnesium transporter
MLGKLLKPEIEELIEYREFVALREAIADWHPSDLAELLSDVQEADLAVIFRLLPTELAADTFEYLEFNLQNQLIKALGKDEVASILNEMSPDDRTALLEELPGSAMKQLLELLSPKERAIAQTLLGYPEDSIGRLMTPDYLAIKKNWTITQVLEHIRKNGKDSESMNVLFVLNEKGQLLDDLRIRDILLNPADKKIEDIMDGNFVSLKATDKQMEAADVFSHYDRTALPVINHSGHLVGIVTIDDIMDVTEEESTEDFHKFGALQDAVFNPLKASVFFLYRKRILWLAALVFMNVFSGAAIASFEDTIQSLVALVFFLPMLIGSGGNAGAQSGTLMIRGLATGDLETKDWLRLAGKEVLVSSLLGITMAAAVALIAGIRAPEIIWIVALSMLCIVMMGSVVGLLLPFVFTKLKVDPATASAPLITSIADISGVLIYFSIATWYLGL